MTAAPPPDRPSPRQPHTAGEAPGMGWGWPDADAEEESAEAQGGPLRLDPRARRRWWVLGSLAVAAGVATAIWFGIEATTGRVHWVDTGHAIVSDNRVDVRFDLRRDPARSVECRLEAQDLSHSVVGRTIITVGPSESSPSRHVGTVETASPAITGYVFECWYSDEEPRHP